MPAPINYHALSQMLMQGQGVLDGYQPQQQGGSQGLLGNVMPVGGPQGTVRPIPITPRIQQSFQKRLRNAGDDEELARIVRDAARYGVDWSYMLAK
jgi:hypothetical protein